MSDSSIGGGEGVCSRSIGEGDRFSWKSIGGCEGVSCSSTRGGDGVSWRSTTQGNYNGHPYFGDFTS